MADLLINISDVVSLDDTYEDTFIIPVQYDFDNITEKLKFRNIPTEELTFVDEI